MTEKVYDTAWRHGILQPLHDIGLRGRLPTFLQAFLSNRVIRVRTGRELSSAYSFLGGVHQGSALSVTLFAAAINGIVDVLPKGGCSVPYMSM